jgi:hypothetical protein
MVFRVILLLTFALAQARAQNSFDKAPPDVDDALRARISKFFQAHVDGKPRLAEQYVADDSKDFFYSANKPRYFSFEISRIDYSDNFTKAKATVLAAMVIPVPGFMDKPMKAPIPSYWKQVDGQWYWYVDPDRINLTPFGKMKESGAKPSGLSDFGKGPDDKTLLAQVTADKGQVELSQEGVPAQVTITNRMPGRVSLTIQNQAEPGLEMKLDHTELKAGEKALMVFRVTNKERHPTAPLTALVLVEPVHSVIPIIVRFK